MEGGASGLDFRILGPLDVVHGRGGVDLGAAKERALLALLLIERGRVVSVDRLVDGLWGEAPPSSAAASVHVLVSRLRKSLASVDASEVIATRPPGYRLDVEPDQVDAERFAGLLARGREEMRSGDAPAAGGTLREALTLWRGPALHDVVTCPGAAAHAARLEEERIAAIEERIDADLACGHHATLVGELESLVAAHPFRERLCRARMLALYRCGRQADALRAYTDLRRRLVDDLGVDPSPEIAQLERAILRHDPSLTARGGPDEGGAVTGPPPASTQLGRSRPEAVGRTLPSGTPSGPAPVSAAPGTSTLVTLLFTDLVGSSRYLEDLGDDAAEAVRRSHFRLLREAIRDRGGHEVKNLGDGFMVVFGSAADAVACAIAMQQSVHRHNSRPGAGRLDVRVGLNVGESIRDEEDYFGSPVVVAKRLCDSARGGQIIASELVARLVGGRGGHVFRDAGPVPLKGMREPVPACEVVWEPRAEGTLPLPPFLSQGSAVLSSGAEVSFVGREQLLTRLDQHLERADAGDRQFVFIAGEPGIGKTRLAMEFGRAAHRRGVIVLFGRCYDEAPQSYQPFAEALTHYVTHCPTHQLAAELGSHGAELTRLVPEVVERVPGIAAPLRGDPEDERYRLFEAVSSVLSEAASARPLVIVLDDLHWADKPTLMLLRHLARARRAARLMIVATYRDTELGRTHPLESTLAELGRDNLFHRLTLSGLNEADVARMMESVAGHEAPADFRRAVYRETDGSPFFVVELLRHLAESGVIYEKDGRWTSDLSVREMGIPEGVKQVIGRRLSRFDEAISNTLRLAAVIGREFDFGVLERVGDLKGDALARALEEVVAAQLIVEEPGTFGRHSFSHALIRETLYDELTTTRRVLLHRRVAEAMEELFGEFAEVHLPELAHHFLEAAPGADPAKAVAYARRAGEQAVRGVAYEEAAGYYERALQACELAGLPDGEQCELLLTLGETLWSAGELEKSRSTFLRAAQIAERIGAADQLARAALGRGGRYAALEAGNVDSELIDMLQSALDALDPSDSPLRARVMARLAEALTYSDQQARKHELAVEAEAMARRSGDARALVDVLNRLLWATWAPDNLERRLALTAEYIPLAEAVGESRVATQGHVRRLEDLLELADIDAADLELEVHNRRADDLREQYSIWSAAANRGMRALLEGRFSDAEKLIDQARLIGAQGAQNNTNATHIYNTQMLFLLREKGGLAGMVDMVRPLADRYPTLPWRSLLAFLFAELGDDASARAELELLAAGDFATIPWDMFWLLSFFLLTEVVAFLGDADRADVIYAKLKPYGHHCLVIPPGSFCGGSLARSLGVLATTAGRFDEAAAHFDQALETNARIRSRTWVAHTQQQYGEMLLRRGRRDDHSRGHQLLAEASATAEELGMIALCQRIERLGRIG